MAGLQDHPTLAAAFQWNRLKRFWSLLARMAMTSIEILPVGLLVSLVSAALLCRPSFMPARTPA